MTTGAGRIFRLSFFREWADHLSFRVKLGLLVNLIIVVLILSSAFLVERRQRTAIVQEVEKRALVMAQSLESTVTSDLLTYNYVSIDRRWSSSGRSRSSYTPGCVRQGGQRRRSVYAGLQEQGQQDRVSAGRANIRFFGDGHTDRVLIHVRHGDAYTSLLLEPFLSQVRMFDHVVGFDDARL